MTERDDNQKTKVEKVNATLPTLEQWRRLSLPSNIDLARVEYKQYIIDLMRKTGILLEQFPQPPADTKSKEVLVSKNKQPIYTALNFNVRAKARMANLVSFLQEFQKTPYMHRIKSMVIERTDSTAKKDSEFMTLQLVMEALVILDAEKDLKKSKKGEKMQQAAGVADVVMGLQQGPVGLFMARWAVGGSGPIKPPLNPPLLSIRNYNDIALRNLFIDAPYRQKGTLPPKNMLSPKTSSIACVSIA